MATILFGTFIVLLLLNVPIAVALSLAAVICIFRDGLPLQMVANITYSNMTKFLLLAIPFFVLAGNIMEKAGISEKLINLCDKMVGHRRNGLAFVTVITSCFFAAISGSGPATVAALGGILIPAMQRAGYGSAMPAGLLATTGSIGIIIPPSIAYVVYGAISGASIGTIFIAGVIPGILMGLALCIAAMMSTRKLDIVQKEKAGSAELLKALWAAVPGLLMPVIILGGIYGGLFTPTEAAAVAAVYGLLVGVFLYRNIKLRELVDIFVSSGRMSSTIMLIVAGAAMFAWFCETSGVTQTISEALFEASPNKYVFLLLINLVLLIAGCFIEANSALYIFVPIMLPVAIKFGYDPVALCIVMTMNLAIGLVTPPVGVNLFVACGVAKLTIKQITAKLWPFLIASIICLLIVTYFPQISMLLPGLLR